MTTMTTSAVVMMPPFRARIRALLSQGGNEQGVCPRGADRPTGSDVVYLEPAGKLDANVGCHGNRAVERSPSLEALDQVLRLFSADAAHHDPQVDVVKAVGLALGADRFDYHGCSLQRDAVLIGKVLEEMHGAGGDSGE